MRRLVLVIALASCGRSVGYETIQSGNYVADELNMKEPELRRLRLDLDLEHDRATLSDGDTAVGTFAVTRVRDRSAWVGDCGTHTSYKMLEPVELAPTTFTFRGATYTVRNLHADCSAGWVQLRISPGERWIFKRPL